MDTRKVLTVTQRLLDYALQQLDTQEISPEELEASLKEVLGLVHRYVLQSEPVEDLRVPEQRSTPPAVPPEAATDEETTQAQPRDVTATKGISSRK